MNYIVAWYIYFLFETIVRSYCLQNIERPGDATPPFFSNKATAFCVLIKMVVSPGYVLADHYKNVIKLNNRGSRRARRLKLAEYIKSNNRINLLLSALILDVALWCFRVPLDTGSSELFQCFVLARFSSRNFEISYAFGRDAISGQNASGLTRNARLRLALNSYLEIFLLSAATYYFYFSLRSSALGAISASLNVGTLAGAGEYTKYCSSADLTILLPFVQIVSTATLVIFSLAMYASRTKDA